VVFRVYNYPPGGRPNFNPAGNPATQGPPVEPAYKPNWLERWLTRTSMKLNAYAIKKMFGIKIDPPKPYLDVVEDFPISAEEARQGGEKIYIRRRGLRKKKLAVKIPAGIQNGTNIRLKGLGRKEGQSIGDLYLKVKIEE